MNLYALLLVSLSFIVPLRAMEKVRTADQADLASREGSAKHAKPSVCIDLTNEDEDIKPRIPELQALPALSLLSENQEASAVLKSIDKFCADLFLKSLEMGDAQAVGALIGFYSPDCSLLHAALQKDDLKMAELLIQNLEIAVLNSKNNEGKTALMLCAQRGLVSLITLLLIKGVDHKITDNQGNTFISYLPTNLQALIQAVVSINANK